MIQPPRFRYTLTVDRTISTVLKIAPKGWDKHIIKHIRNEKYYGVFRSLTAPMEFVNQGRDIIVTQWRKKGVKADVQIEIDEFNDDWSYSPVFRGPLDFSNISENDNACTIIALDNDIAQKVKAKEAVAYQIPIDGVEATYRQIPSLRLMETARIIFGADAEPNADYFPQINVVSVEAASTDGSVQGVNRFVETDPNFGDNDKWWYRAVADTKITITGSINVFVNNPGGRIMDISLYNQTGGKVYTAFNSTTITGPVVVQIDAAIDVVAGSVLYWYFDSSGDGDFGDVFVISQGDFTAKYFTQSPSSSCRMLPAWYVFGELMKKICGEDIQYQTYLLRNTWKNLYLSCGDALRGLETKQSADEDGNITISPAIPAIKTTFNDFFQSINSICGAAFGTSSGAIPILERKEYFFVRQAQAATIQRTKNVEFEQMPDYMYNSIKGGYVKQTYDQVNGRDEFNSEAIWDTPIEVADGGSPKEYDIQSRYRADMYGIEFTRINLADKKTVDADSDNETFVFVLTSDLTEIEQAPPMYSGTLAAGTMYNWRISPARNLRRHGPWLRSNMYGLDAYKITFASGDKNSDLYTVDELGLAVKESDDISIANLGDRIFIPIKATFQCDYHTLAYLDTTPNGYLLFPRRGKLYKGFIMDAGVDISRRSAQEYTLILTADNIL